jgi:hypothetical protein
MLLSGLILLLLGSIASPTIAETVHGTVILSRHGDRKWDPNNLSRRHFAQVEDRHLEALQRIRLNKSRLPAELSGWVQLPQSLSLLYLTSAYLQHIGRQIRAIPSLCHSP